MSQIPNQYRSYATTALRTSIPCGIIGNFSSAADVAGIVASWAPYLISVADDNLIELDLKGATKICSSVALGAAGYYAGCKVATKLFTWLGIATAGLTTVVGCGISALQNVIFTYYFCCAVNEIMEGSNVQDLSKIAPAVIRVFAHFTAGDLGDIVALLINR